MDLILQPFAWEMENPTSGFETKQINRHILRVGKDLICLIR